MLNQTKFWVDKLKEVGFKRNEFSCRTPYNKKKGGWGETKITIKDERIRENLGYFGTEGEDEKVQEEVRSYIRERVFPLLDMELGMTIVEMPIGDRYVHISVYNNFSRKYDNCYLLWKNKEERKDEFDDFHIIYRGNETPA